MLDSIIQIIIVIPDGRILLRRPIQRPFSDIVRRNGLPWQVTMTRTWRDTFDEDLIDTEFGFYYDKQSYKDIGVLVPEWMGILNKQFYYIYSIKINKLAHLKSTQWTETRLLSFDEVNKEMAYNDRHKYTQHAIMVFDKLLMLRRQKNYVGSIR